MSDRLLFEADHAPGNMTLTASRMVSLVIAPDERPLWTSSLYALALHMRGDVPIVATGDHLRFGHLMEPVAYILLAEDHGIEIANAQPRFERDDIPALCYPDAELADGRLVEVKTLVGGERAYQERWASGPPLHVRAQAQAQMLISGRQAVLIVPVIVGHASIRCEVFEEPADAAIQNTLLEASRDFMAIVTGGGLPAADGSESSYRALLATTELQTETVEIHGREIRDVVGDWQRAKLRASASKGAEMVAKAELARLMGTANEAKLDDGTTITRKATPGRTEMKPRTVAPSWRWSIKETSR